jgi:hypothetical protein
MADQVRHDGVAREHNTLRQQAAQMTLFDKKTQ